MSISKITPGGIPRTPASAGVLVFQNKGWILLLAYLDEIGSPGAFASPNHPQYKDSPAFGYGGFIIPEESARKFGALFAKKKEQLFAHEIPEGTDPGRREKKGQN